MRRKKTYDFACKICKEKGIKSLKALEKISCSALMEQIGIYCGQDDYIIDDSKDYIYKTKKRRW